MLSGVRQLQQDKHHVEYSQIHKDRSGVVAAKGVGGIKSWCSVGVFQCGKMKKGGAYHTSCDCTSKMATMAKKKKKSQVLSTRDECGAREELVFMGVRIMAPNDTMMSTSVSTEPPNT